MGTRHLIAVVAGNRHRIAQYGQWDGYPSGQGVTVADFAKKLNDPAELAAFKAGLEKCRFATEDEMKAVYKGFADEDGWMTMEQSNAFAESKYGYLSRNTGAGILELIGKWDVPEPMLHNDSFSFAADGLFCEWAYVIDLDNEKLEVYSGFHGSPAPEGERFAVFNEQTKEKYGPVHLLTKFTFAELALMTEDEFIKAVIEKDKELKPDNYEDEEDEA